MDRFAVCVCLLVCLSVFVCCSLCGKGEGKDAGGKREKMRENSFGRHNVWDGFTLTVFT